EVKVTLRVEDPRREGRGLDGEVNEANNEMSTFVTVTKEGLSVLLVDKPRAWEPQLLCEALRKDARIRLYTGWLRGDEEGDRRADREPGQGGADRGRPAALQLPDAAGGPEGGRRQGGGREQGGVGPAAPAGRHDRDGAAQAGPLDRAGRVGQRPRPGVRGGRL